MLNLYFPAAAPEPHFQPGCGRCIFDFATICKKETGIFFSWSHVKEESSPKSEAHPTRQLDSLTTSHFFSLCTFISRGVILWFASFFSASLLGFFLSRRLIYFFSQLCCCALFNSRGKNTAPALRKLLLHNYVIATQICFPLDDLMVRDSITFILQNYLMILGLFTAFCRLVGCCTTLLQTELNLYVWEIRARVENSIGSPLEVCAFFQLVSSSKFLS